MARKMNYRRLADRDLVRERGGEHYADEMQRHDPHGWEPLAPFMREAGDYLRTYRGKDPFLRRMARERRSARRLNQSWEPEARDLMRLSRHLPGRANGVNTLTPLDDWEGNRRRSSARDRSTSG